VKYLAASVHSVALCGMSSFTSCTAWIFQAFSSGSRGDRGERGGRVQLGGGGAESRVIIEAKENPPETRYEEKSFPFRKGKGLKGGSGGGGGVCTAGRGMKEKRKCQADKVDDRHKKKKTEEQFITRGMFVRTPSVSRKKGKQGTMCRMRGSRRRSVLMRGGNGLKGSN